MGKTKKKQLTEVEMAIKTLAKTIDVTGLSETAILELASYDEDKLAEFQACRSLLLKKSFNLDGMPPSAVIQNAQIFKGIQKDTAPCTRKQRARDVIQGFASTVKPEAKSLADMLIPLVDSQIGPNPSKGYAVTFPYSNGDSLRIGINFMQDPDSEALKLIKENQKAVKQGLLNLIAGHEKALHDALNEDTPARKDKSSFGLFNEKLKVDKYDVQLTLSFDRKVKKD